MKFLLTFSMVFLNMFVLASHQDYFPTDSCEIKVPALLTQDCNSGSDDFTLYLSSNCVVKKLDFSVYNRWGAEVGTISSIKDSWDASKLPSGTYFWVISGKFADGEEFDNKGYLTLTH